MYKISCADFAFPKLPLLDTFKLIRMLNIDWVDVGLFQDRTHIWPDTQLLKPEKNGAVLKAMADACGLGISDIYVQTDVTLDRTAICHPDPKVRKEQREAFLRTIEYTLAAECKHISNLPGIKFDDSTWEILKEELAWRVEEAGKYGIGYGCEPCIGSILADPDDALRICKEVPGYGHTLDHSHFTVRGISMDVVKELIPYATHMHGRGARKGQIQSSIEESDTDFVRVKKELIEADYDKFICLEYNHEDWENCKYTDNLTETIILNEILRP